jgi:hypothetical protein
LMMIDTVSHLVDLSKNGPRLAEWLIRSLASGCAFVGHVPSRR